MKDWQHGYELDHLKEVEALYDDYNQYTLSPFAKYKKNNIAESLHKKTLKLHDHFRYEVTTSKVTSKITMYADTVIGIKEKGDLTISKLSGNIRDLNREIKKYFEFNVWLYVWSENTTHVDLAEELGFVNVGTKISSYGEIQTIFFHGEDRNFPIIDEAESVGIKYVGGVHNELLESIYNKLNELPEFTNHYSNYNKKKAWSAVSLRGYSDDPSFITKPSEMNSKWNEEHADQEFFLQDTTLMDLFPEVLELIRPYGKEVHRIRFMNLAPDGGELTRHTDQVDKDSGGSMGKLARLHFPISTNNHVKFNVWGVDGVPEEVHMKVGDVWFLDTRKPHTAINEGKSNRIHLVVDVVTEGKLHAKLLDS
jgi:hypothetical protein